jgi:chloride channel 7
MSEIIVSDSENAGPEEELIEGLTLRGRMFPSLLSSSVELPHFETEIFHKFDYFDTEETHTTSISNTNRWLLTMLTAVLLGLINGGISWAYIMLESSRLDQMSEVAADGEVGLSMLVMMSYCAVFGLVACLLVLRVSPAAGGSGIPDIKAFLNGNLLPGFLSRRTLLVRLVGVILVISSGVIAGPEGPMAHVGVILSVLVPQVILGRQLNDRQTYDFAAVGSGIGIASAFLAPIAGTLFALEEAATYWDPELISRTFFGSMIASIVGEYSSAGFTCEPTNSNFCVSISGQFAFTSSSESYTSFQPWEMFLFIVMGILTGAISVLLSSFLMLMFKLRYNFSNRPKIRLLDTFIVFILSAVVFCTITYSVNCATDINLPVPANEASLTISSAICGGGMFNPVALILLEPRDYVMQTLFSGSSALDDQIPPSSLAISLAIVCIFFLLTSSLPIPAGTFIPNVLLGSIVGRFVGSYIAEWIPDYPISPGIYAIAGASGILAGTSRMTIWIVVIMIEASGQSDLVVPIALSAITSKYFADFISPVALTERFIEFKKMKFLPSLGDFVVDRFLRDKLVKDIMSQPAIGLYDTESIEVVKVILKETSFSRFPVLNSDEVVIGITNRSDLEKMITGPEEDLVTVPYMNSPLTVSDDFDIRKAYFMFYKLGLALLPITKGGKIAGIITRDNFINFLEREKDIHED